MALNILKRLIGADRNETRNRPRTCYLHIGPPKTGSTSIQRMLKKQSAALERVGIRPAIAELPGGGSRSNHSHLADEAHFPYDPAAPLESAPAWRLLAEDIELRPESIVLSGEAFAARIRRPADYDRIVDFFMARGFALVIVAYVRDQIGWINSTYGQHVKNLRSALAFDDFVARALDGARYEFGALFDRPMGDDRVKLEVGVFEQAAAQGLELDFLRRVGAGAADVEIRRAMNPNLGAVGVHVACRLLDELGPRLAGAPAMRREVDRALRRLAVDFGWTARPYMGFDASTAERVRARFRASNDSFARARFGASWAEICPAPKVQRSVYDPAIASIEEAREVEKALGTLRKLVAGATQDRRLKA